MKATTIGWVSLGLIVFNIMCCHSVHAGDREIITPDRPLLAETKIGVYQDTALVKLTQALVKDYESLESSKTNRMSNIQTPTYPVVHDMMTSLADNKLEACVSPRYSRWWGEDTRMVWNRVGFHPSTQVIGYVNGEPIVFLYDPLKEARWGGFAKYIITARAQDIVRNQGLMMLAYGDRP